ncbi:protein misato homolog 1-like [Liolophura sinensis]|uniref:protein misato homolog 1-like n=1 Tax=Liolophura sinensis TaxID=3198878 RepID=UPI003158D58D
MSLREIVTLQVGHYSNFVGTHWWNLQEASFVYDTKSSPADKEINHDVLFREGRNLMGDVTFTPRLISVDLKDSLNTLRQEGTLYDVKLEEDVNWEGDVTLHNSIFTPKNKFLQDLEKEDEALLSDGNNLEKTRDVEEAGDTPDKNVAKNEKVEQIFGPKYYNLDSEVKVWSDFLRIHLHPRSLNIVQEYTHNNPVEPFDIYGCGERLFSSYSQRTSMEDQIHFFTEESDNLQGFHILSDVYNGFGGITSWISQYLEEEFPNKGTLTFGMHPAVPSTNHPSESIHHVITSLLSYDKLTSMTSLVVPLSLTSRLWKPPGAPLEFHHLNYKPELFYHTSAVLASALDTASLPYRLESNPCRLSDITHSFHHMGRRVAGLSASLPFPMPSSSTLVDTLVSRQGGLLWTGLTPGLTGNALPYMQSVVLRGIPDARVKSGKPLQELPRILSQCEKKEEILKLYITEMFPTTLNTEMFPTTLNAGCIVREPCKVGTPFPHIFSPRVSSSGWLSDTLRSDQTGVDSVPIMTSLQNSPEAGTFLQELHGEAKKINIRKHHQFLENGLEEDDFRESLEHIQTLFQCYD